MSRIAIAATLIVAGWSVSVGMANADPVPPPPPPGPKTTIEGDGTYAVGSDIAPGTYESAGPVGDGACYWKRVNGSDIVDNALSKKPQFVQIDPTDTAFTTNDCQPWQKTDAAPPPHARARGSAGPAGHLHRSRNSDRRRLTVEIARRAEFPSSAERESFELCPMR